MSTSTTGFLRLRETQRLALFVASFFLSSVRFEEEFQRNKRVVTGGQAEHEHHTMPLH